MKGFRFWNKITLLSLGKLCQQRMLLAGLALLCFLLPIIAGPAAEAALSQGVSFSGLTMAIAAPEGDSVPKQLEQVLSGMQDIRRYCQVKAMDYPDALDALEQGEVTAVLVLPEQFVQGILNGTNPDVELIVSGDRPLEAMLTYWVGQSASEMLAAFQSGIYAVLELYVENPPAGITYSDAVAKINLRYISWMMNRQDIYRIQTVDVAQHLPVGLHYSLSLFAYLALSLAPMLAPLYDIGWIRSQRRYRCIGRGSAWFYTGAFAACWLLEFVLIALFQLVAVRGEVTAILWTALLCSLFCAAYGTVCCLLTADTGSCGVLSFSGSLVFLVLSGGILPPVLMPGFLQKLIGASPVTWLRNLMAIPADYEAHPAMIGVMAGTCLVMILAGGLLYRHRGDREVANS